MTRPLRILVIAGAFCAALPLAARQEPDPSQDPILNLPIAPKATFSSESNLVVLHVNVFDGRSDAVPDLPQHTFQVFEDGKPQEITFFRNEDVPVAVGLIIDNSSSMITRRPLVLAGTRAFAQSSHPDDELFTIVFNEHVRYGLPDTVSFTQSQTLVEAALSRFTPGGLTALHDAVIEGLEHLQEATHQKRVLVVLTDGDDNASQNSSDTMIERATRSDALIYTVSTANLDSNVGKPRLLRKLAELSGGTSYQPKSDADVIDAFTTIAANIRRGYSIGYVPSNSEHDGRYRRVKVSVRAPGYKNLSVSARDGYLAPRHLEAR